jgi:Raf kinase inhibitor-like YbhB/YbcL family protein
MISSFSSHELVREMMSQTRFGETLGADRVVGCSGLKLIALSTMVVASVLFLAGKEARGAAMSLQLSSAAFSGGQKIPVKFTCDGSDASPELSWRDIPAGTKSFALIMDDPDAPAGTWVHWVLYNIPAESKELPEAVPKQEQLPDGALQGHNSFRKIGYGGPCPPPGKPHRYYFRLYALDSKLDLKAGATKADVERAMKAHVLGEAELIGRFGR